jgi:ComF family protein
MSIRLTQWLLDLLAPATCVQCGAPCQELACSRCLTHNPIVRPVVVRVRGIEVLAAASYEPPVSVAVRRFKYEDRADLARPLARLLHPMLAPTLARADYLLIPVPLHPRRLAQRGYNQAALLARQLSRFTGAEYAPTALARVRDTPRLAGQSRRARALTAIGSFVVRSAELVQSRPSILIDDVVTTGATAAACIDALRAAGATVAAVAAVARALPPTPSRASTAPHDPRGLRHGPGTVDVVAATGARSRSCQPGC